MSAPRRAPRSFRAGPLSPGEVVDRYEVIAPIASGGMAAVYAARRVGVGGFERLLAIKVMLPHLAEERRFVDMFLDEARIASAIQHPNVVRVLDVGRHRDAPYIVMEFLRGLSVSRMRSRLAELDSEDRLGLASFILARAAEGLHAAHETRDLEGRLLEVVHRDVSPHNVHVGYDGQVKVVDFGIAAARGRLTATATAELKGKHEYMAPEQIDKRAPVSPATDVWALAVCAWNLFAGARPFRGDNEAMTLHNVLMADLESIREAVPELPAELAEVFDRALERSPQKRPGCVEMVHAFDEVAARFGVSTRRHAAELMRQHFAEERRREDASIAKALEAEDIPSSVTKSILTESDVGSHVRATVSTTPSSPKALPGTAKGRGRPAWALPALAGGLLVTLLLIAWGSSSEEPEGTAVEAAGSDARERVEDEPSAPPTAEPATERAAAPRGAEPEGPAPEGATPAAEEAEEEGPATDASATSEERAERAAARRLRRQRAAARRRAAAREEAPTGDAPATSAGTAPATASPMAGAMEAEPVAESSAMEAARPSGATAPREEPEPSRMTGSPLFDVSAFDRDVSR